MTANLLKYKKPRFDEETCLENKKTHEIIAYIPINISYKRKKVLECEITQLKK